jgi:histidinol-phosphate aminotransferase
MYNRYPDAYASELCEAFAAYHGIPSELITAGNGSDELINVISEAFLKDGSKVVNIPPDFSMYAFYANLRRAETINYTVKADYSIDCGELVELIKKENADMLFFSNPGYPTSRVINGEVLYIVKNAPSWLIDEEYMDFSDQSVLDSVSDYPNLIVLRTMSKAFACAALRVGFAVANIDLTTILKAVKSPYNVNVVSQTLAKILLKYKEDAKTAVRCIIESRDKLYASLAEIKTVTGAPFEPLKPSANFVFIKTDKADEIYNKLLSDGIAVRYFDKRLRITAGSENENAEIIEKLRSY